MDCTVESIILPSWLVSANFGTWSLQYSLSNFTPVSLHTVCYSAVEHTHILPCLCTYCSFANIGLAVLLFLLLSFIIIIILYFTGKLLNCQLFNKNSAPLWCFLIVLTFVCVFFVCVCVVCVCSVRVCGVCVWCVCVTCECVIWVWHMSVKSERDM